MSLLKYKFHSWDGFKPELNNSRWEQVAGRIWQGGLWPSLKTRLINVGWAWESRWSLPPTATQWLKNEFCVSGRYTPWAMVFSLHNFFHFPMIQQSLFELPFCLLVGNLSCQSIILLRLGCRWWGGGCSPGHQLVLCSTCWDVGDHLVPGFHYPSHSWCLHSYLISGFV